MKIVLNQLDLIPNHISVKGKVSRVLVRHKEAMNQQQSESIYNTKDQTEIKGLIKEIYEFVQQNAKDHFLIQLQVLLLLMINLYQMVNVNVLTGSMLIPQSLLDLVKKNQKIQQTQLQYDESQLHHMINEQLAMNN